MHAETVIAAARALTGAPYRHRGRGPIGYDCLGVVLVAGWRAGVVPESYDFTEYTTNVADYELEQHLNACPHVTRLDHWSDAQPADILLQRFHNSLPASHLILITKRQGFPAAGLAKNGDGGRLHLWGVHASLRLGQVTEQGIVHLERNLAAYRLIGVSRHG